jgi:radical SAM protein with 4Fe4S-binding SPASM domain
MNGEEAAYLEEATRLAHAHGMTFSASGAVSEPGMSLKRREDGSPWSLCRRPWTVMYFTANGRALPCCIAPFSQHGYENYTLGDATQESLRDIWNGARYQSFRAGLLSDTPPQACANCGLRWSL